MKTSAIIRIVIYAFLAVLLVGILCVGILKPGWIPSKFIIHTGGLQSELDYPDSESYTRGGGSVQPDLVEKIEVHWGAGEVLISTYDGDRIRFSETADSKLSEDEEMRYLIRDGKLFIQHRKPFSFFGIGEAYKQKTLTLEIPASMTKDSALQELKLETISASMTANDLAAQDLRINTTSGDLSLTHAVCDTAELETTSGNITTNDLTAQELTVDAVSGEISLDGDFSKISAEAVSGDMEISSKICPEAVEMDSVSGNLTLLIPENDGFTAGFESVSGDFFCDFPTQNSKHSCLYENGEAEFRMETVSGDMQIKRIG